MAGPAVTASGKAKKILADLFNAAALPADAVPHHRRGTRGARIEQRREDRTHVSKHQIREGDECGVSGLLPPSRWHLGKKRAGRMKTERVNTRAKTEDGREEIGCSEEEEETQEFSKGCSENTHRCKG